MSKLINLAGLTRFWTKAKDYIDNGLNGKANSDHTHNYAASSHTHSNYSDVNHTHANYAAVSHGHAQSEITGLTDALAGKASSAHSHAYADLTGKPTIPTAASQLSDYANLALKTDLSTVYKYKGSKATFADLPASGNAVGDVWDVAENGMNYAWTGSAWDNLGTIFEIDTATNTEIDAIFA